MRVIRYKVRSHAFFQHCMQYPGRGAPYSTRSLAVAAQLKNHQLVQRLADGSQETCEMNEAHRIAEAVGVGVLVLFAPPTSPERIDPTPK